jgi:hypothetical protein
MPELIARSVHVCERERRVHAFRQLPTTTDVYMQEIPAGVEAVIEAVNQELRLKPQVAAG